MILRALFSIGIIESLSVPLTNSLSAEFGVSNPNVLMLLALSSNFVSNVLTYPL
jgi:hypothetical protein